jgi:hypothetical protein
VDVYREKFDAAEFSPPGCHPTPYGNQVIAKAVYAGIGASVRKLRQGTSAIGQP